MRASTRKKETTRNTEVSACELPVLVLNLIRFGYTDGYEPHTTAAVTRMLRRLHKRLLISGLAVAAAACCSASANAVEFQEIPGLFEASDISDDGSTVVGTRWWSTPQIAIRWRRGAEPDILGDFAGGETISEAFGVSGDGSVVVGRGEYDRYPVVIPPFGDIYIEEKKAAFRWTAESGLQSLHPYSRETPNSVATAITADGQTIFGVHGHSIYVHGKDSFRWTESEGLQPAPIPVNDASSDGNVLVGIGATPGQLPGYVLRWTPANGIEELLIPDGLSFEDAPPLQISGDGNVVWGNRHRMYDRQRHPYIWTEAGGYETLLPDMPAGINIKFVDTNHDGMLFVGEHHDFDPPHTWRAILWNDSGGITFLDELLPKFGIDLTGWQLQRATGVSADGSVIVGRGFNPDGQHSSWIVTLPMLVGDYNADGMVDAADYIVWRHTLGSTQDLHADGDLSGVVDEADYTIWKANFGRSQLVSSEASDLSSAPEPSLQTLVVVGAVALTSWRRVRRPNLEQ